MLCGLSGGTACVDVRPSRIKKKILNLNLLFSIISSPLAPDHDFDFEIRIRHPDKGKYSRDAPNTVLAKYPAGNETRSINSIFLQFISLALFIKKYIYYWYCFSETSAGYPAGYPAGQSGIWPDTGYPVGHPVHP
jgi:hypothetical protein